MKLSEASPLLLDCEFLSRDEYLIRLEKALNKQSLTHIVTLNAEMVVEAQRNDLFRESIAKAELKIPDGSSMLWAREYLTRRHPRPDRGSTSQSGDHAWIPAGVYPRLRSGAGMTTLAFMLFSLAKFLFSKQQPLTGVDSILDVCEIVEKTGGSVCLVGGKESEAQGTAEILRNKYSGLSVSILSDPTPSNSPLVRGRERDPSPFQGEAGCGEKTSAVFVALGAPKQTLWIEQNRKILEESGIRIAIGIGGAFAMISGILPRAPQWMQRHHLEWLWRLILEPKRFRRIWNAVVVFPRIVRGYPH